VRPHAPQDSSGFTLLELILVLALLTAIIAVAAPDLRLFLRGRDVTEECRRIVALTRHARNEAISRGQCVELWIDSSQALYGLRGESASVEGPAEVEFSLGETLALAPEDEEVEGESVILFWPDGTIDEESPQRFELTEDGELRYTIALAENRLEYVVETPDDE